MAAVQRLPIERRLAEGKRAVERIVAAVEQGRATSAMLERMIACEAEKKDLEAQLTTIDADPAPAATMHPLAPAMFA